VSAPTNSVMQTAQVARKPKRDQGALTPAMRSFVDNVLVPALVRSYLAETQGKNFSSRPNFIFTPQRE